ncbi:MAG: type II toxin-antitoxin system VapC family toxin [Acidobacteriota bacterium]|nr:type II toxin-antitoxin system VapC family toxin [Acidobacteriota bacterium]
MAIVVDTDVVSFLYKYDTRAVAYRPHLDGQMPIISFQTLAELEQWPLRRNWGARRRQDLLTYLRRYLVEQSSPELCRRWAEAMEGARRAGRPILTGDAWVAATALSYGVPLVTNNPGDFAGVAGLTVISEAAP